MIPVATITPPCYVCDLQRTREKYQAIVGAFRQHFKNVILGYSYKTNYLPVLCRTLHEQGAYAEVVSGLEYQLAKSLGVPPARIVFNGTGRSAGELIPALSEGAIVNIDSLAELDDVLVWARGRSDKPVEIGLRITAALPLPIQERQRSRFGLCPLSGELSEALRRIAEHRNVNVVGLHAHLSSKVRDSSVFRTIAESVVQGAKQLAWEKVRYLDVGGGFGYAPPSMSDMNFPPFPEIAAAVHDVFSKAGLDLAERSVIVEPGIGLIGDCMSYWADVLALKRRGDMRMAVVGGSIHTIKPVRHGRNLPTTVLGRDGAKKNGSTHAYDVVGYTCMEDDYIALAQKLPELAVGDTLIIENVGAYTLVFKPPFIRGVPAIYAVDGAQRYLVRPAETFEQFFDGYELTK